MYRALIVEDEVRTRDGLRKYVSWKKLGFTEVYEAAEAGAALAYVRDKKPDLVLLDIRLPGMDGLTLLERMRLEQAELVVIIISGYKDFSFAQRAVSLQAFEYLLKPVQPEQVDRVISRAMGKLRAARSTALQIQDENTTIVDGSLGEPQRRADAAYNLALAFMQRRYADRLTIKDVARASYVSDSWCAKIIKEKSGMNFLAVLTQIRMRRAAELLTATDESVASIARLSGYSDTKYFSQIFRETFKQSPARFRQTARYGDEIQED